MPSGATSASSFRIPSLNGLRAVAILIVLWGHAELPLQPIGESTGVTLFFFLSGYLITTLLRREHDATGRIAVGDFYLRRAYRIFPPLYIVLVAAVLLSAWGLIENAMTTLGVTSAATFWANYFIIFEGRDGLPGGMNALWSLAVEEHFYLVFPVLYLLLRRWLPNRWHQAAVLVSICLVILGWRMWLFANEAGYDRLYLATDTRADAILWGAVLALTWNPMYGEVRVPRRRWVLSLLLFTGAAVFWGVSRFPAAFSMTVGYTLQALALGLVFIAVILAPTSWAGRFLNWRPVAWFGLISYSVYLIHRPALFFFEQNFALHELVEVALGLATTVLLSWAMLVWVERPFGKLRRRRRHAAETANEALPHAR